MNTAMIYIIIMNVIGFCLMGLDKHRAGTRQWRVPEKILFGAALLGAEPGRGGVPPCHFLPRFSPGAKSPPLC